MVAMGFEPMITQVLSLVPSTTRSKQPCYLLYALYFYIIKKFGFDFTDSLDFFIDKIFKIFVHVKSNDYIIALIILNKFNLKHLFCS